MSFPVPGFSEEDYIFDYACDKFHTDNPTEEQLKTSASEWRERVEAEATNYYNQNGEN